ncbi:T9SS type A sorting domain-containing protein [Hymenobacter monticola]|uniref:T9SS type A sorting domain-containing protein n=1 Tax=Hymenobacter monticola TaxID=1705399 RepID=A0ABY4B3Y5_9BACT|nr:T9SS type A sorting domain-containing protein [Hymenobacter monticola]UOE33860.1 T9SS type A sorting domain-containing protein [Hymenobacter monticola]
MMTRYSLPGGLLGAALFLAAAPAAHAQLPYAAANAVNVAGTYADLGSAGTAIGTGGNFDDANSAAQSIGFSFAYNGQSFTQFVLNTNGFLKLGAVAPAGPFFATQPQADAGTGGLVFSSETNVVLPFNTDLRAGTAGAEYRVATTGTAGSQVCTIQWKNVQDKPENGLGTQYDNFSFQVKLYEGSNQIEFVYGPATAGPGPDALRYILIGLKGNSAANPDLVLAGKNSTDAWSLTGFRQGSDTHNARGSVRPDAGRTYRFTAAVPNDAAVFLYSYDQLAVPPGSPATLRALVTNVGTTTLAAPVVTLTVAGANTLTLTQTATTLAPGARTVVTFANVPVSIAGANTVTATLPNDGNNGNNVSALPLLTTATTFSYVTPGLPNTAGIVNTTNGSGVAARFTISAPATVAAVRAYLVGGAGASFYGVVLSRSTGAVLARSANYVLTAADQNTLHTFPLTAPVSVPAGDFLVGIVQASTGGTTPALGTQNEAILRSDSFFFVSSAGAVPNDAANTPNGKFMLEAVLSGPTSAAASAALDQAVRVFPNPSASGWFELETTGLPSSQPVQTTVTTLLGQRVHSGTGLASGRTVLDLSALAAGVYVLQVQQGNLLTQRRLVINK